jgi:pimeloyl-ACP methyl ester carboxylesterase
VTRIVTACLVLAVAAGCGSSNGPRVQFDGPIGTGANAYYLYRPTGHTRAVVVYLHGLDESELNPANHRPWLWHLAREGDAVVYPRYEAVPGAFGANRHIEIAVERALQRLKHPSVPIVVIGYSRGGRLAVEWAAVARAFDHAPQAVMSIFPGSVNPRMEELIDLRALDPKMRLEVLVGEADQRSGAQELLRRLEQAGFPASQIDAVLVRSRKGFVADHFSVFQTSAAARTAFWDRADRMVEAAVRSSR